MKFFDSFEVEKLKRLIDNKKEYFMRLGADDKNKVSAQFLQREIMFLQNDIMPLVLQNANIAHWEMLKYVIKAYEAAITYKCNSLLLNIPIAIDYEERPKVGIANPYQALGLGEYNSLQVYCNEIEIINMDGSGVKAEPTHLEIDGLM